MVKGTNHTANFLVSSFLMSNRCLKPIYRLNSYATAILRYICDSMDIQFKKTRSLHTRLYHSQIAAHSFCSIDTVKRALNLLISKRLLSKVKDKKCTFTIGKILTIWGCQHYPLEVVLIAPFDRSRAISTTSNSSNITNKRTSSKTDPKALIMSTDVTKQSTSYGVTLESPEEAAKRFEEQMAYFRTVQ